MQSQPNTLEMTNKVEPTGKSNGAFVQDKPTQGIQSGATAADRIDEVSPLTYIDFVPERTAAAIAEKEHNYANFGSVVDQANRWLLSAPQFEVYKCETVSVKIGSDHKPGTDQALLHIASNGKSTYVRILRLWLIPRTDSNLPVQQLAYITQLPDYRNGSLTHFLNSHSGTTSATTMREVRLSSFDNLRTIVDKLNQRLQITPLPGRVVTVETLPFKCLETGTLDKLNTESSAWSEEKNTVKLYLNALRVFYMTGPPACESISFYDEVPKLSQSKVGLELKLKFATFNETLSKASQWLREQKGVRVVNFQTVIVKLDRTNVADPWIVDSLASGYTECQAITESRYTKVLRIAYVKGKALDTSPLYSSINLTSRIFIPARIAGDTFDTVSRAMQHVAKWLRSTGTPLLMCETTRYLCSVDSTGQGFNHQRPDYVINGYQSQYYLMCIRLYFPTSYEEPDLQLPAKHDSRKEQSCSIS